MNMSSVVHNDVSFGYPLKFAPYIILMNCSRPKKIFFYITATNL